MVEPTDFLELRGETFEALAQVEDVQVGQMAGDCSRALLTEHEHKGNLVSAQHIRKLLEQGLPRLARTPASSPSWPSSAARTSASRRSSTV